MRPDRDLRLAEVVVRRKPRLAEALAALDVAGPHAMGVVLGHDLPFGAAVWTRFLPHPGRAGISRYILRMRLPGGSMDELYIGRFRVLVFLSFSMYPGLLLPRRFRRWRDGVLRDLQMRPAA